MTTTATDSDSFGLTHFGSARLGDQRRTDRLVDLADRIYRHPGGTLPQKLHDPPAYKAMDRLVNRPEVSHASVLAPHRRRTRQLMAASDGVVLVLHDTTELDYSGLRSIADLGPIGGSLNRGLLCHNSLAVDPAHHEVHGLANQILHRRRPVGQTESVKDKRERADRESRLWIDGCDGVGEAPAGCLWVHVADRGADTFEFLARPWGERDGFLLRSKVDRVIRRGHDAGGEKDCLHRYARSLPLAGRRQVHVAARDGKPERVATVAISFAPVLVMPPQVKRGLYVKRPLRLWVVRVAEVEAPAGVDPLEWILVTDREVATQVDAWERKEWYECRWIVEEYHKGQKTGCSIEELQFTSSAALEPMVALLSVVAVGLLQLREAARRPDAAERPAAEVVDGRYVAVLSAWRYKEVRPELSVQDFYRALARLGGHADRGRRRLAGWLVLWRGWMALQHMVDGAEALSSCGVT
jgi:hypothetical protein